MQKQNPIYSEPSWRIIAWQHLSFVITKLFFFVSRSKIKHVGDWSVDRDYHYVIAGTHVFWFDPFMATTALGWKRLRPLLPCRFIAAPKFLHRPWLRAMMRQLGSYPAHSFRDWAYGIDASLQLMNQRHTIVIFPQGRMTQDRSLPAKRGVSVLADQPKTLIVPVHISRQRRGWLPSFSITVGIPYRAAGAKPDDIMQRIYEL